MVSEAKRKVMGAGKRLNARVKPDMESFQREIASKALSLETRFMFVRRQQWHCNHTISKPA